MNNQTEIVVYCKDCRQEMDYKIEKEVHSNIEFFVVPSCECYRKMKKFIKAWQDLPSIKID